MHLHVNAYQQMQHVMTQMAFFDLKFGSDLLDRVAEPLLEWSAVEWETRSVYVAGLHQTSLPFDLTPSMHFFFVSF